MKDNAHRIITTEAIKLLPEPCKAFFDRTYLGETALELIVAGAVYEDYAMEPLGEPQNLLSDAWHESSTWEGWMQDIVKWFKDDKVPWLEHYWSQDLGYTGLSNPVGITGLEFRAAPERAQDYWDQYVLPLWQQGTEEAQARALGYFGRVVHLLEDMGTPAHVNNDCHMALDLLSTITFGYLPQKDLGMGTIDDDDYEDYVGERYKASASSWPVDPMKQSIFYHPDWTLRDYNRRMAEIATMFDSDDVDGRGHLQPYRWDSFLESSDPHRDITFDLTDYACNAIATNLISINQSFVAGLMLMFLKTTGFEDIPEIYIPKITLKKITVHDDTDPMAAGEIYINFTSKNYVHRFGRYKLSDGDSYEITQDNDHSYTLYDGEDITLNFNVFDDDSWYFEPKAKESLGKLDLTWPPAIWRSWIGTSQQFSLLTSNGRATLDFEINLQRCFESSEERLRRLPFSMKDILTKFPPLEFSCIDSSSKMHHEHCHHLKQIEPTNLRNLYMFHYEFETLKENLRVNPAHYGNGAIMEYLAGITRHDTCKTCDKLREKRAR